MDFRLHNRYGLDELGRLIAIISVLFFMLASVLHWRSFYFVAVLYAVYFFYRIFSSNHSKRTEENRRFLLAKKQVYLNFHGFVNRLKLRKDYRLFTCGQCKQKIKVPKHKGRIVVTCPRCGHRFGGRS